jgi:hypothetical protein
MKLDKWFFRKMFFLLAVLIALAGTARAATIEDIVSKIPATNAGAYFSIDSKHWEFISTFQAAKYKGFNLNLGYASPDSFVAMLGYEIAKLENLGVEIPVLKDLVVDAGWALGWREPTEEQEFTHGPAVTFSWKW